MRRVAFLLIAALALAATPAWAHRVNVFAYVEGDQLKGEGYFPGGAKAEGCKVELVDQGGKVLARTVTDKQGAFTLPKPKADPPLTLILYAGGGHRATYQLTAADLGVASGGSAPAAQAAAAGSPSAQATAGATATVDPAQVQAAVERALDRKLAPIRAMLARMEADRGIGVQDVVGGLGWILGLVGLAAWMRYRKQG